MSASNNKWIQPIDSIETYVCRDSKGLIGKKQDTRYNNIIKQHKNILKGDDATKENIKKLIWILHKFRTIHTQY